MKGELVYFSNLQCFEALFCVGPLISQGMHMTSCTVQPIILNSSVDQLLNQRRQQTTAKEREETKKKNKEKIGSEHSWINTTQDLEIKICFANVTLAEK